MSDIRLFFFVLLRLQLNYFILLFFVECFRYTEQRQYLRRTRFAELKMRLAEELQFDDSEFLSITEFEFFNELFGYSMI